MSDTEFKPEAPTSALAANPPDAAPNASPVDAGPPTAGTRPAPAEQSADLLATTPEAGNAPPTPTATKPEASAEAASPPPPGPPKPAYGDAPALPEGIAIAKPEEFAKRLSTFDAKLGDLETKFGVSHEAAAAFRQEVLQMAFDEIAQITRRGADAVTSAAAEARRQLDVERATQRQQWRQEFDNDPTLAGNNRDTTLWRANAVIDEYAADRTLPPAQRKAQTEAFKAALRESGLQNHPAMVRLLRNVGNDLVEGNPVPALKAPPPPRTKAEKLYRS